jgi:hypothetical protein
MAVYHPDDIPTSDEPVHRLPGRNRSWALEQTLFRHCSVRGSKLTRIDEN